MADLDRFLSFSMHDETFSRRFYRSFITTARRYRQCYKIEREREREQPYRRSTSIPHSYFRGVPDNRYAVGAETKYLNFSSAAETQSSGFCENAGFCRNDAHSRAALFLLPQSPGILIARTSSESYRASSARLFRFFEIAVEVKSSGVWLHNGRRHSVTLTSEKRNTFAYLTDIYRPIKL